MRRASSTTFELCRVGPARATQLRCSWLCYDSDVQIRVVGKQRVGHDDGAASKSAVAVEHVPVVAARKWEGSSRPPCAPLLARMRWPALKRRVGCRGGVVSEMRANGGGRRAAHHARAADSTRPSAAWAIHAGGRVDGGRGGAQRSKTSRMVRTQMFRAAQGGCGGPIETRRGRRPARRWLRVVRAPGRQGSGRGAGPNS